ncbi:enoyl-ACP reductase, partial [Mycobacterium sp. ITM-2017-0098]
FEYAEQMSVGRSVGAPVIAAISAAGNVATMELGSRFANRVPQRLLDRVLPKPGTGPSDEVRERGHYTVETYTTTTTGARYVARMS